MQPVDNGENIIAAPTNADPQHEVNPRERSWRHAFSAKWRIRLREEISLGAQFKGWPREEWESYLKKRRILSDNYDTVVSLDWPHFCSGATEGCGGENGWCYTLAGHVGGSTGRSKRAAITDRLARDYPGLFASVVAREVSHLVKSGRLPYANLRFSGSGEIHRSHLPALTQLAGQGIHLWGFSRNIHIATKLREEGISVLFSCDSTTPIPIVMKAASAGLGLAYTSTGIGDVSPIPSFVTFPVHKSGRVREVVASDTVCPKVLQEYLEGRRRPAACQTICKRCHMVSS